MTELTRKFEDIPLKEIQTAIKALNDSGLVKVKLKVVGSKENLLNGFIGAINSLPDDSDYPDVVVNFYNSLIEGAAAAETEEAEADEVDEAEADEAEADEAEAETEVTVEKKKEKKEKKKKKARDDTKAKFIAEKLGEDNAKMAEVAKVVSEKFEMSIDSARSLVAKISGVRRAVLENSETAYGKIYRGLKEGKEIFPFCVAMISTVKRYMHLFE